MRAIFHRLCPNCKGAISDERLQEKLPCSKCLPKKVKEENFRDLIRKIYLELKTSGNLKYYAEFYELERELENFERFFESKIGNRLWSAQKTWARRLIKGESFTIIAPTGVGKTTLASVYAVYLTKKERKKVYLVVPTTTLVKQVKERIEEFGGDVIAYYSGMKSKEKGEFLERLKNEDFSILVTTSQFLARKFEDLREIKFDLIFVDDVDALLKASKNIERVLMLLGFSEEDIEKAMYVINLKSKIPYTRDEERLQEIFEKINRYARYFEKKRKEVGQLILSSATARPRGKKPRLFRELLGFEIGESGGGLRKIVDMYIVSEDVEEKILEVLRKFGTGGLIFVSKDLGEEYAYKLRDFLKERGINCDVLVSGEKKDKIEKFREGEIDILIGVAHFYGLLVRGIDLPERVRYVVFYEVPRFKVRLSDALLNPYFLIYILDEMYKITGEKDFDTLSNVIQRFLRESSRGLIQLTLKYLAGEEISLIPRAQEFVDTVLKARLMILEKVKEKETLERLKNAKNFYFDGEFVYFPDVNTYIQASGRCSRLFAGGLTQGASIVVTKNERLLKILERKLSWRISDFEFKRYEEVNLDELIKEIDRDRDLVRKIQRGEIPPEFEDPIKSILFIVESPNKARTIANFFGRPSVRRKGRLQIYEVTTGKYLIDIVATVGHIFDLVTEEGVHGVLKLDNKWIPVYSTIKICLDCGNTFTDDYKKCPICGSTNIMDRREIVEALREMAKEVDLVLIATDPDSVSGDSKVLVKWNREILYMPIEELYERLLEKEEFFVWRDHEYIRPKNLYVLGYKDGKIQFVKVNYLIRHFVKKPLYRIRTRTGREIRVTGDHSLFTIKGLNIVEVKASNLKPGDYIVCPKRIRMCGSVEEIDLTKYEDLDIIFYDEKSVKFRKSKSIPRYLKLDEKFLEFLGVWVGDGCYHKNRYVRLSVRSKECIDVVKEIAGRFSARIYRERDGVTFTIMSKPLYQILKYVFRLEHGARNKRVPEIVFKLDEKKIAAFLRGLFSADGTVSKGEPNIFTSSEKLKEDVCWLLLRLGIIPKVYKEKGGYRIFIHGKWAEIFRRKVGFLQEEKNKKIVAPKSFRSYIDVIPFGSLAGMVSFKKGMESYAYAIYHTGKMSRERAIRFLEKGFLKEDYKEKFKEIIESDIFFDEVVEIEEEKDFIGYVYDFDTESDNFVANCVLCHNTEGEKIAWDVQNIISPYVDNIKRAEFHEVTERAILNAIEHPRDINYNLVEAQIVRRIEDRWIGFELSQKLWEVFKNKNLSAGRVQTPVLKWIIDRYDERQRDLHYFFTLKTEGFEFEFDLPNVKKEEEAREIIERIKKVKVKLLKEYEREVNPLPPFETQTMISEASRRLKWTASKTMQIAQELFESGLITYHRTDSIRVSPEGIGLARRYISENFGEKYYKGRPWGSGGAHECIRPTRPLDVKRLLEMISEGMYQNIGRDHIALYELIFRRFIASQMVPAKVKYAVLEIEVPEVNVRKEIEVPIEIIEEGWLRVNPVIEVKKVQSGELDVKEKEYRLDSEIFLYTEGSLVQEMKERRIGRPSTYATIISKIKKRRYVKERYYLIPTRRGRKVCKFLFENYEELINEERTRELEEKMDRIERGEVRYQDILWELYEELKKYNLLTKG